MTRGNPQNTDMRVSASRLGGLLLAALLAACATTPPPAPGSDPRSGAVDYRALLPEGEGRHEMQQGQGAAGGAVIDAAVVLPVYPAEWVAAELPPFTLTTLVVIDGDGRIARTDTDTASLRAQCGDCAEAFAGALDAALAQWTFEPLAIIDWVDTDTDGDGEPDAVQRTVVGTRPYSLRFAFDFRVVDGEGSVARQP